MKEITNGVFISMDVYKSISPVVQLSRICGLCPVRIVKGTNSYNLVWSRKIMFFSCVFVIILVVCSSYGLMRNYEIEHISAIRLGTISSIICTISENAYLLISCLLGTLLTPFCFKHFWTYLESIGKVDLFFSHRKLNQNKKCITVVSATLIATFVMLSVDFTLWANIATRHIPFHVYARNAVPFYLTYVYQMILELYFWIMIHLIKIRIIYFNQCLLELLKDKEIYEFLVQNVEYVHIKLVRAARPREACKSNAREINDKRTLKRVKTLTEIQMLLYEASAATNDYFGKYVLVILFGCLMHLLVTPYDLYLQVESEGYVFIISQLTWLACHILRLIFVIEPCQACKNQTQLTSVLICKIMACDIFQDSKTQFKSLLRQLGQCQIQFTANGLVNIDRTLLTMMAGTVTTYLVILFQFK